MDEFLAAIGVQAMRYAIRSSIALTSTYALGQCSRLLKTVDDKSRYAELKSLEGLLESKIKVISPAIDLVELKAGRGNVFLESAAPLTKSLHRQIIALGRRIDAVASLEEQPHEKDCKEKLTKSLGHFNIESIVRDMKSLLERIDCEIPLLQLAISASGESLSNSLPAGVSPSRLLQASTLLVVGDTQYAQDPTRSIQIGPVFALSVYMLFLGHSSVADPQNAIPPYGLGQGQRKPLWQEAIHKAQVRLCRAAQGRVSFGSRTVESDGFGSVPQAHREYTYFLEIAEDFDDGRVHDNNGEGGNFTNTIAEGIRERIPILQLSKLFYADMGRLLNIGDTKDGGNNPVLLLKRDVNATASPDLEKVVETHIRDAISDCEESVEQADIDQQLFAELATTTSASLINGSDEPSIGSKFPRHLDPEWMAFEVFEKDIDDDNSSQDDADAETTERSNPRSPEMVLGSSQSPQLDSIFVKQIQNLSVRSPHQSSPRQGEVHSTSASTPDVDFVARSPFKAITTSLSLIEMLIRLASLQEFQQSSHLTIPDHILTFFLEETSTTGFTEEARWKARNEAKHRVGFDPYTDTPSE